MATEKRLVDVNALIKKIDHYYNNSPFPHPGTSWLRGLELAVGLMLNEPTVNAAEVVRCKDCKNWEPGDSWMGDSIDDMQRVGGCPYARLRRLENDFCSFGERKDNEI